MNHLMSINNKFFDRSPIDLVTGILNSSHIVDGVEICSDMSDQRYYQYIMDIVGLFGDKKFIVQIHAPSVDILSKKEALQYYSALASIYGNHLILTAHPTENIEESLQFIEEISSILHDKQYDLSVCIENLNDFEGIERLNISQVNRILKHSGRNVGFCWDIGHDVHKSDSDYTISRLLLDRLTNIHIHDIVGTEDHHPYSSGRVNIQRAISYLISNGYNKSLVHEISLDYLNGITYSNKMSHYVKEIENVRVMEKILTRSQSLVANF